PSPSACLFPYTTLFRSVALGVASVLYWDWSERQGAGDLRFYFAVQFFPLLALPVLLLLFAPRYTGTEILVACLACYALAKVLELDRKSTRLNSSHVASS